MNGQENRVPGMLSVCIPVYNFTVVKTVDKFLAEIERDRENVEVVVFDDGSDTLTINSNAALAEYGNVRYLPLIQNMGRSKIRNRLADFAKGEWLLFLDCDMSPVYSNFLARYINSMTGQVDVVCGGVTFGSKPEDRGQILRWKYDRRWIRLRKQLLRRDPALRLETGNFMIRYSVYARCGFDESLEGYGQEDKVFAYNLSQLKARIQYIDNPAEHLDKETNEVFLSKIDGLTLNRIRVWNANPQMRRSMLRADSSLLLVATLHRLGLLWLLNATFRIWRIGLRERLKAGSSWLGSLRYYQICTLAEAFVAPNLSALPAPKDWSSVAQVK